MATPLPYDPRNWYWVVAGSTTQVYSSAAAAYVTLPDATYTAWLASGGQPSLVASEAELWAVLAAQYPAGIAAGNVPGQEAIAALFTQPDNYFTLRDNVDPTKKLRWQLSGIATATVRTWTVPNADLEVVGKDTAQTLTNKILGTSTVVSATNPYLAVQGNKAGGNQWRFATFDTDGSWALVDAINSLNAITAMQAAIGAGVISVNYTTPSTSYTSGALYVAGGVGVQGNINAGGSVKAASGGIGYASGIGAGSTVTQITSKSTSVTVNTPCGKIIMHNAALAANTAVKFTLSGSGVKAGDVLVGCLDTSTCNTNNYTLTAGNYIGDGFGEFCLRNVSAGSLSEAVGIWFVVIRNSTT